MNDKIGILKINQKKLNLSGFSDIEKSYQEGIYSDTPSNRKLGRVGMSYKQYADKLSGKDEGKEPTLKFKINKVEEEFKDYSPNYNKIKEETIKNVKKLNYDYTPEYKVSDLILNLKYSIAAKKLKKQDLKPEEFLHEKLSSSKINEVKNYYNFANFIYENKDKLEKLDSKGRVADEFNHKLSKLYNEIVKKPSFGSYDSIYTNNLSRTDTEKRIKENKIAEDATWTDIPQKIINEQMKEYFPKEKEKIDKLGLYNSIKRNKLKFYKKIMKKANLKPVIYPKYKGSDFK